jgi:hypothetical protein
MRFLKEIDMAKQRKDSHFLFGLVSSNALTPRYAMELAALPLVVIPHKPTSTEQNWRDFKISQFHFIPSVQKFMLHEVMVLMGTTTPGKYRYGYIRIMDDMHYRVAYMRKPDQWVTADLKYNVDSSLFHVKLKGVSQRRFEDAVVRYQLTQADANQMRLMCATTLALFQQWCEYNNRRDRYLSTAFTKEMLSETPIPDVSTPNNKTTAARSQQEPKYGPMVVYLDGESIARAQALNRNETGVNTVKPHVRCGYNYTLMNERFRKHPLFRKYKEMWRKPCYVGDRTLIIDGTTYTVLEAETEEPVPED